MYYRFLNFSCTVSVTKALLIVIVATNRDDALAILSELPYNLPTFPCPFVSSDLSRVSGSKYLTTYRQYPVPPS